MVHWFIGLVLVLHWFTALVQVLYWVLWFTCTTLAWQHCPTVLSALQGLPYWEPCPCTGFSALVCWSCVVAGLVHRPCPGVLVWHWVLCTGLLVLHWGPARGHWCCLCRLLYSSYCTGYPAQYWVLCTDVLVLHRCTGAALLLRWCTGPVLVQHCCFPAVLVLTQHTGLVHWCSVSALR